MGAFAEFWEQDCPARGVGLYHRHFAECEVEHISPPHDDDQCCHCFQRASMTTPKATVRQVRLVNTAPDRELLGREVDEIVTPQMLELRNLVGGFKDPLPAADKPRRTLCKLCAGEHVTFAVYLEVADVLTEYRLCAGCLARMVERSRQPLPQLPANAGPSETYQ